MKKLRKRHSGEGYIDVCVLVVCAMLVLALVVRVLPVFVAKQQLDTYAVELQGNSLGMLIGRRGDTLDAIQHITNYAVNHGQGKRVRINVDAENYRKKREESLIRLANKVAGKVVRSRRNITLEPMNAYERHVIHAALQDYPDVTTYSTGTEPGRRIVVAYSKYRSVPTSEE